jgi:c-di-GMP-binding flagellar brake protein YcgR
VQDHLIRAHDQILALLYRLRDRHTLIQISNSSSSERPVLSVILAVSPDEGCLIVDAPPASTPLKLDDGEKLRISARLDGVEIRFSCTLEAPTLHDEASALQLALPGEAEYLERRREFRARISAGHPPFHMGARDQTEIQGQLLNLSIGGFGALVKNTIRLESGEMLDCSMELLGELMQLRAEVRQWAETPVAGQYRLGARFVDVEPQDKRRLERIVACLERRTIRNDPTR